ncbi:hypothetical protein TNCV_2196031 [Trichonephila clavipes]|nr:hypothetical protein TNCV_2196031 [Trichonephila clavipes]
MNESIFVNTVIPRLTRTRSYAIFKSRRFAFPPHENSGGISAEPDEIGNVAEEIVDFARQINLVVDSGDVQELLDSHNQELTMDELVEMYEREQDIEELVFRLSSIRRSITVGNWIEGLS